MYQRRFSIGVWIEVFGIDRKEIGSSNPFRDGRGLTTQIILKIRLHLGLTLQSKQVIWTELH